ncbi:hypothetical protein [Fortiea contorta]|uniref:hypothetical protein n=1 Tax=Fortiea contorta TaxID=1892405 RepID=UPI000365A298|nr:hypothetical protein [Fortiea contorta]
MQNTYTPDLRIYILEDGTALELDSNDMLSATPDNLDSPYDSEIFTVHFEDEVSYRVRINDVDDSLRVQILDAYDCM